MGRASPKPSKLSRRSWLTFIICQSRKKHFEIESEYHTTNQFMGKMTWRATRRCDAHGHRHTVYLAQPKL